MKGSRLQKLLSQRGISSRRKAETLIREGRKRQIRKIADILHHPVIDLKRISIAEIALDTLE